MPSPGRPKKTNPRDISLEFRVSGLEKQAFHDAASLAGVGLSTWIRERLRRAAIRELEEANRSVAFIEFTL